MVTSRSFAGISFSNARNRVVLPEPVPPATTMLRLANTAADKNAATDDDMKFNSRS